MRKIGFLVFLLLFVMGFNYNVYASDAEKKDNAWSTKVGGEERLRYESFNNYELNNSIDNTRSTFFNRLRLNASAAYKKIFSVFVEGLDAREWVYETKRVGQADQLDLHQAYVDFKEIMGTSLSLRAGRQKLSFGKERIIGAPSWSNKITSFDAVLLGGKLGNLKTDLFAGNKVQYDEHNFNDNQGHELLSGIYNTYTIDENALVDAYFVSQIDKDNQVKGEDNRYGALERYTQGTRLNIKNLKGIELDCELAYQTGKNGTSDINAYALACYIQKQFNVTFKPKLRLEFNFASGDNDVSDGTYRTFVPVYQSTHGLYGIIDFFRWQNMRETAIFSSFEINEKLSLEPEFHAFWLDQSADSWYKSDGTKLYSNTTGETGSFTGTEASLVAKYKLTSRVKLEAGYSRFFSGSVARKAGQDDGVNFGYLQTTVSF